MACSTALKKGKRIGGSSQGNKTVTREKEKQREKTNRITSREMCFVLGQLIALSSSCVLEGQGILDSRVHALPSASGGMAVLVVW